MSNFYKVFRCFAKPIVIYDVEYRIILDFIFTIEGEYMGLFNGHDDAYEIDDVFPPHPDEIFCCCCMKD
jgi:hypothetical protein